MRTPLTDRLRLLAPILAAAALCASIVIGGTRVAETPGTREYHERVAEAISRVPYKIGPWLGQDLETPLYAVKLLKPNKILQRRYDNFQTGEVVTLMIVHCGDVRDMIGHFPPNCYPAHGWRSLKTVDVPIRLGFGSFPSKHYTFDRLTDGLDNQTMAVRGFFVLPGGDVQIVSEYQHVIDASQSAVRSGLGAAQIQLLSSGANRAIDRPEVVESFLSAIEPAIREIASGTRHDNS